MSDDADIAELESDDRLRLLTEALRAGPGSAEWAAAVDAAHGLAADPRLDEYALLVAARRRLADGRAYRSVRAGPGFGRRLMARVEASAATTAGGGAGGGRRSPLSPGLFAVLGLGVVVAVIGMGLSWLFRNGTGEGTGAADLAGAYFSRTVASATLDGPLPPGWRAIGSVPLVATDRLALPAGFPLPAAYGGGGLVNQPGVASDEPVSVQARFHFGGHVGTGCVPQLFVADSDAVSADRGVAPHELVWLVQDGQAQVATADGHVADAHLKVRPRDDLVVSIRTSAEGDAAVVCNGQVAWTGRSGLAADGRRFAGVRLLYSRPDGRRDGVSVTDLKVQQK